ncbi:MAG: hypothetical protein JNM93_11790 [Bacteriovoracaceae bacterium]|nr:hypothetical protein [Bacteriovoracaceae bacterium]
MRIGFIFVLILALLTSSLSYAACDVNLFHVLFKRKYDVYEKARNRFNSQSLSSLVSIKEPFADFYQQTAYIEILADKLSSHEFFKTSYAKMSYMQRVRTFLFHSGLFSLTRSKMSKGLSFSEIKSLVDFRLKMDSQKDQSFFSIVKNWDNSTFYQKASDHAFYKDVTVYGIQAAFEKHGLLKNKKVKDFFVRLLEKDTMQMVFTALSLPSVVSPLPFVYVPQLNFMDRYSAEFKTLMNTKDLFDKNARQLYKKYSKRYYEKNKKRLKYKVIQKTLMVLSTLVFSYFLYVEVDEQVRYQFGAGPAPLMDHPEVIKDGLKRMEEELKLNTPLDSVLHQNYLKQTLGEPPYANEDLDSLFQTEEYELFLELLKE